MPLEGPQQLLTRIDYVTSSLAYHAGLMIKTVPEGIRLSASLREIEKKRKSKKQEVIETYFRIDSEKRNKWRSIPNRLCTEVIKEMELRGKKPPAKNTVEKYLKEEGLL